MRFLMMMILTFAMGGCNVDEERLKALNALETNRSDSVVVPLSRQETNTTNETNTTVVIAAERNRTANEDFAAVETNLTMPVVVGGTETNGSGSETMKEIDKKSDQEQEREDLLKRYASQKELLEYDLALKKMQLETKLQQLKLENEKLKSLKTLDLQQRQREVQLQNEKKAYELQLAKLQEETRAKIAEIEAKKEREIADLQAKQALRKAQIENELEEKRLQQHLAMAKIDREAEAKRQTIAMQQAQQNQKVTMILIAVVAGLVLLGLLILYLLVRRNQQIKLRMHEEQLQKEKEMRMMEMQNQRINKMLDIVSSREKLPEKVEKELLSTIREGGGMRFVIDEDPKRKKRLIFRD